MTNSKLKAVINEVLRPVDPNARVEVFDFADDVRWVKIVSPVWANVPTKSRSEGVKEMVRSLYPDLMGQVTPVFLTLTPDEERENK